jgi:hypothetical protein
MASLTFFVLQFFPMSLVSSILSMGGRFALDSSSWWIYFAFAVPRHYRYVSGSL